MNSPHRILTLLLALAALLAAHTPALAETVTYTISGDISVSGQTTYANFQAVASGSATGTVTDQWNYTSTQSRTISLSGGITLSIGTDKTSQGLGTKDALIIMANNDDGGYITLTHSTKYIYHVILKNQGGEVIHEAWNQANSNTFRAQKIDVKTIVVDYATAIPITDAEISGIDNSYYVSNTAVTPEPTVTWHGTTLTKDTHYTVTYKNNTTAGTATVTATGKGKFSSSTNVSANYTLIWMPRYTFDSNTGELTLIWGEFNKDNKWGSEVTPSAVTSVTATDQVSFTGDCYELFYGFSNCTSMDLNNVNTSDVTEMNEMFRLCSSLTSLDLSNWVTANVTNMRSMFSSCSSLQSLDLSGWNTANVTTMSNMFTSCSSLQSLDLSGWNTANVTDMSSMFSSCSSLQSLDLSGWNTANVTDMSSMFYCCSIPQSLDLSGWNTANVTNISFMFYHCSIPQSLDLSGWNTANVTHMNNMFDVCTGLKSLDLSGWNTVKVRFMDRMFNSCNNLKTIYVGTGWSIPTQATEVFKNCMNLVGGKGTNFNSNHTNQVYARIDKGPNSDQPGYLTGVFALTLGEGITATTAATLTHGNVNLYAYGTQITLAYGGSVPAGNGVVYLVNGIGIEGNRFEMPAEDVTVTVRSVGPSKSVSVEQATIFSEGKYITSFYDIVPYQLPAGALAYTASLDGDNVVFHRIGEDSDIIPANTAVIIVADASAVTAEMITLTKLDSASGITARTGNILQGSDEPVEVTGGQIDGKTVYVLGKDANGTLGFYPFSGISIPAGKAYYVAQ